MGPGHHHYHHQRDESVRFFFVDQVLLPQKSRGLRLQRVGLGDVGDDSTGQSLGEEDPQVKIL
jgi:hypothetical protein